MTMKIDETLLKKYAPMTETAFYILFNLQKENHGYNITKDVSELTSGEVNIGAGTMYGSLGKFEKDGLIVMSHQEDKRKYYRLTDLGKQLLEIEIKRIDRVHHNIHHDNP